MSVEQYILAIGGLVVGGGGLGAIITAFVTRKLGLKSSENEAKRDTNNAWDTIVESLQAQITTQTDNFTSQLLFLANEVKELKAKTLELEQLLTLKDRIILKAIAHINKLEALVPPKPVPDRPEELQ